MIKIGLFSVVIALVAISPSFAENYSNNDYVKAIYKAEGGKKAKKPYGILSVPCDTKKECRQICYNTVRNNRKRYKEYGHKQYDTFLEFLASRYCPVKAHPLNKNWLRLVKYFLRKNQGNT